MAKAFVAAALGLAPSEAAQLPGQPHPLGDSPWQRHTIDDSLQGADGVRLGDINSDGFRDIVTGWEESGVVRVYVNPGPEAAQSRWPAVTAGRARNVEDAVFVDLDADGQSEVVSASEGRAQMLSVHWPPNRAGQLLDPSAWRTEALPGAQRKMMWMFTLPLRVDRNHGIDLLAGGKGPRAELGWWEAPMNPVALEDWKWRGLRPVGWIMSLAASDMDGDGDEDVVFSDRKGERTGCFWLERPNEASAIKRPWVEHVIGGQGREVMFLTLADLDGDSLQDVLVAAKPRDILYFRRLDSSGSRWAQQTIPCPPTSGTAKAVAVGDVDLDGQQDLVFTCEQATDGKSGVMWLQRVKSATQGPWTAREVSGAQGVKFDLVQLLDLDDDGDLDVLTCEESEGLGVIWYENPLRKRGTRP